MEIVDLILYYKLVTRWVRAMVFNATFEGHDIDEKLLTLCKTTITHTHSYHHYHFDLGFHQCNVYLIQSYM
jgi:hypothetical protein